MRKTEGLVKQNMDSVMNPLDISVEPVVVPETPEPKRPPGPVSERMVSIVLDTDSDSDLEISGTSLVLPGKQAGILKEEQVRDAVIVLSDEEEEEEERKTMTRQKNGGGTLEDTPNQTTELPGRMLLGADDPARKRKRHVGDSSPRSEAINSSKKQAPQQEPVTDDSEDEGWNPSWKSQEDMVKRLQLTFPCLIKEELREALMQHDWRFEDTLGALRLFSEEVKGSSQQSTPSSPAAAPASQTPATPASQTPAGRPASPPSPPHHTANGTAGATARAAGRRNRRPPRRALGSSSSEDEAGDSEGLSEWGDSDEGGAPPRVAATTTAATNDQILRFFQEASLDELTLIHGCSLKKAQRIIELRPYEKWEDLMVVFQSGSGLSSELLQGCRVVLREQQVVRSLMKKCESISGTMRKDVTQVLKGTWSYSTQPQILNRQYEMKPYQLIGLNWLSLLHRNKLSGILADEMGLGKTIQAIAFLASLYQEGNTGPHLITVPASTLDNWVRELNLWCPSLKVLVYYGSIEERRLIKRDILDEMVDYNVIISTYAVTIGNSSDRSLFRKIRLEYAVFDEGHMLKNMSSLRYRHLMDINAKHRLLLTGTPLQNNLLELMSLLNFIMPDMFSNSTSQIVKMFSMKSSEEQSAFEMERIAHAKLIIKPFILRRVKSEVLQQLPAKEQKVENCAMTEKQQRLYDALFQKLKESTGGEKREMTNVMMQLRKMANHPLMHRQYYSPTTLAAMSQLMLKEPTHRDANPALVLEDMMVMTDYGLHRLCLQYPSILDYQLSTDLLLDSGKLSLLTQLLASLKSNGDRVVLFSQFTMMLDILEVFLKHHNHRFIRLDGSTPMSDRIVLIDQFNTDTDIFVFLLSTKAGGLGINLTSANVVILHDIDCNPYNDKQAEDRCHRVGQSRTVRVFKLISKGSIEDAMLRIGQKKLKLEQDITTIQEGNEGLISEDMASVLKASLGL